MSLLARDATLESRGLWTAQDATERYACTVVATLDRMGASGFAGLSGRPTHIDVRYVTD
jgi:hypothetical protein